MEGSCEFLLRNSLLFEHATNKEQKKETTFLLFGLLVIYNNVRFLLVRMLTCFPNTNLLRESTMFMFPSKRFPSQGLGGRVFDPCSTEKFFVFHWGIVTS